MSAGPSRSQIACNPAGSSVAAKPLASAVNPIPALAACCLAHSWPFNQILIGYGRYEQILTNAGPNSSSHR